MSNRSRDRGNGYEREVARELREMGYDVVTSRSESKRMDDKKVDIFSPLGTQNDRMFPFYIQNKFTANNPAYNKILDEMPDDRPGLIFHKKSEAKKDKNGKTRHYAVGEYVTMKKVVFYDLINKFRMMTTLEDAKKLFNYLLESPNIDKEVDEIKDILQKAVNELTAIESLELLDHLLNRIYEEDSPIPDLILNYYKNLKFRDND